ncbi:unnamed protein product [Clonostachys rhizophaga]|uniref:Uncharacterized protein n=1 Tax=Clonostachys rhizophaga TaxID=160324 RepID=A0A9N9VJ02_9HYPO|nr:unnamed protein product [Clonostachys rhizophaga]
MAPRIPMLRPALLQRPFYCTARPYSTKAPNPTSQFYKTFTRPIAKVVLGAVLTYQLVYWAWVKLETDEIIADTAERKVDEYKNKTASDSKPKGS